MANVKYTKLCEFLEKRRVSLQEPTHLQCVITVQSRLITGKGSVSVRPGTMHVSSIHQGRWFEVYYLYCTCPN